MPSDPDKTTLSVSHIQDIIDRISKLCKLTEEYANKADPPQQTTVDTNAAANNQTQNPQDGSTGGEGDGAQGTKKTESDKGKDAKRDGGYKKTDALHDLGKLFKELDYMYRSFQKLEKFEKDLSDPLKTLEANVNDIVTDLKKEKLPKQVEHNLRVLRNNITRVKILIPSPHQAAGLSSEGNRGLQTTVATGDTGDLPHLYEEDLFKESYYFQEIREKYESLEDESLEGKRLKLSLLCFAIFPENSEIKKRFLRFWWVGENLIPPQENRDEKDVVNETLKIYVEKGLIQPVLKKNRLEPRSYKMDPIVRSCLISFAKEAGFFHYDQEGKPTMDFSACNKACMVRSEGAAAPWFSKYLKEEQEKLPVDLVKLQMLFNFPNRETLMRASRQFDKLQTLFNLSKQFPGLPKEWFAKMTTLKVLYMGKWESTAGRPRHIEVEDIDFLKALTKMKNLRLLSLQGVSGIPTIPRAVGQLENLKILDLRACHNLERLPDKIGLLKELIYLDLSECYLLDYVPRKLSELKKLEVLKGFVIVDTKNSCTLDDLSKLEELRKLSINVNTTNFDINDAKESLVKFKQLKKLRMSWGSRGMPNSSNERPPSKAKKQQPPPQAKKQKQPPQAKEQKQPPQAKKQPPSSSASDQDNRMGPLDVFRNTANKVLADNANRKTTNEEDSNKQNGGVLKKSAAKNWWEVATAALRQAGNQQQDLKGLENLVKLDLQCFPYSAPPEWLVPSKMVNLMNLSIRGGKLSYLEHDPKGKKWKVETLRLKFLVGFKMNWKEMQDWFPRLKYLENVRSPRITLCPCDLNGIWQAHSN
ncbi:uncharacterized protein LOC120174328 [Hibiscus syriacus]|uniref:uncharacterized protein LOC120174328 n=1 Tax=Hibiscus syriacus TaxID=106335 RepID=UPI0019235221|nr:uncharacterized protein LOC120174328 [Hibiscus syriacus]